MVNDKIGAVALVPTSGDKNAWISDEKICDYINLLEQELYICKQAAMNARNVLVAAAFQNPKPEDLIPTILNILEKKS